MASAKCLKPSAPSPPLLRFLRAQSDDLCFFTSSRSLDDDNTFVTTQTRAFQSSRCLTRENRLPASSRWTTAEPMRQATRQASLLDLFSSSSRNTTPSSYRYSLQQIRSASTSNRERTTFFRRLFDRQKRSPKSSKLQPNDLPALPGFLDDGADPNMFHLGRSRAAKATDNLKLRCTELDRNGNVTLVNGEFKKSELIAKYGLLPRDLRKIDSSFIPNILVRPSAILISLLHLRVLIKSDRVLVFDAYGSTDSYTQSLFMYDLEGKLRTKDPGSRTSSSNAAGALPYEFRALEAVLISVTSGLESEFEGVREPVVRVLRELEEDIDRDKLRHLLIYSKKLGTFEQKARLVRDAIEELLDADDDLAAMYLSERDKGVERDEQDHQEVEMLLESYHKVCDEIVQVSGNLVNSIRNTEEIVKAILDANRNSLMLLELKFSIGTLGLATGTLFSAFYGMNLKNFIEESDLGFVAVSGTCLLSSALVCFYALGKLRSVQRVRMWGEGGSGVAKKVGSRGNWMSEAAAGGAGPLKGRGGGSAGNTERSGGGEEGRRWEALRMGKLARQVGDDDGAGAGADALVASGTRPSSTTTVGEK